MHNAKNPDNRPAQSLNEQHLTSPNLDSQHLPKHLVRAKHKKPITTSRMVALAFNRNHQHVLRDIRDLGCSDEFNQSNFGLVNYKDKKGELRPEYEITRDGLMILIMGYSGVKAMAMKEAYIARFNAMEQLLMLREGQQQQQAIAFVELTGEKADFHAILGVVPFVADDYGRKCYHYLLGLEKLGFSTRSGSVWKRERRNPIQFIQRDNATYVTETFLYNMFLGRVKAHNDKAFRSQQAPLFTNSQIQGGN
jgi:Rha family phage regulatory protein